MGNHVNINLNTRKTIRAFCIIFIVLLLKFTQLVFADDDTIYIAFTGVSGASELESLKQKIGVSGKLIGKRQLAVSAHLNPLGNKYTKGAPNFEVDEEVLKKQLEFLKQSDLPVIIGIFAGKFFESDAVTHLEKNKNNLMFDQNGEPILIQDRQGGTYFAISPALPRMPPNEYLVLYERNIRRISKIVADWMKANPGRLVAVSYAGETKYPPAKFKGTQKPAGGKKAPKTGRNKDVYRWADYGPYAVARFRDFAVQKYQGNFSRLKVEMGLQSAPFRDFSELDPPRGKNRGSWDALGDPANRYFMFWQEFRIEEVKNHIRETVRWGKEEGIVETETTKIYSHQAIWDTNSSHYYWRGAPIETLELPGINPVVSMYSDKTNDTAFIQKVSAIARNYPGRWGTLQYNPDGPDCASGEETGEGSGVKGKKKSETCSEDGFPVVVYSHRLKLLADAGVRVIGVYTWTAQPPGKHFIRNNFFEAIKQFLSEPS
jgi:hypothetical protein